MHPELGQIITQIVGFLVALWILKRFAWKPMLYMLENRRDTIRKDLDEAAQNREETAKTLADYEARLKGIDVEARAKIQEAVREGQAVAAEVKNSARKEAQAFLDRAREEIERDKAKAKIELKRGVVNLSLQAAEKLLGERMDSEKDRRMVEAFIDDLEGLKE